jgi:hypothetical protein
LHCPHAILSNLAPPIVAWPVGQIKRAGWNIRLVGCRSRISSKEAGIGRAKGEVEQDEEALRTMHTLGQNMAWLLKKTHP